MEKNKSLLVKATNSTIIYNNRNRKRIQMVMEWHLGNIPSAGVWAQIFYVIDQGKSQKLHMADFA